MLAGVCEYAERLRGPWIPSGTTLLTRAERPLPSNSSLDEFRTLTLKELRTSYRLSTSFQGTVATSCDLGFGAP